MKRVDLFIKLRTWFYSRLPVFATSFAVLPFWTLFISVKTWFLPHKLVNRGKFVKNVAFMFPYNFLYLTMEAPIKSVQPFERFTRTN